MRRLTRRVALGAMLVAAAVTIAPTNAAAHDTTQRQRELERQIRQTRDRVNDATWRERGILRRLRESDERRARLEAEIARIGDSLRSARDRLTRLESRLDEVTSALALKTVELDQTIVRLHEQTTLLNTRAAQLYMGVPEPYSAALELAESFADVVDADEFSARIYIADVDVLHGIEETRTIVEQQRTDIAARREQIAEARRRVAEEEHRIYEMRLARRAVHREIRAELNRRAGLLREVRARKGEWLRALRNLEEESRRIADQLRGWQRGQRVFAGRGGWLRWPVSGRVTSGYGWRTHPIYGTRRFHSGIDISAPQGRTVHAARRGRVLYSGYRGGYGLAVIIDHGGSVATLYAHLSRTYVRAGEYVSTMESIAAVGSTGLSTGPHLHFEVRVRGWPQNPLRWL